MITTAEQMIEQYVSAWNETSLEDYQREFARCWADDGSYCDPTSNSIKGVNGIATFAYKSLDVIPERKFSVSEKPEHHHGCGHYTWKVEFSGHTNTGYDYFEFNKDFKITRLVSFFTLPDDYPIDKVY